MFWTKGQANIYQSIYDQIPKEPKNVNFDLSFKNSIDNYHQKRVDGRVYDIKLSNKSKNKFEFHDNQNLSGAKLL